MTTDLVPYSNSVPQGSGPAGNLPGGGGNAVASGVPAVRKDYIERVMREDYGRYLAEGLDRAYLEILEQETADAHPDAVPAFRPLAVDESRAGLCESVDGQQLVRDWDGLGGFAIHLRYAQDAAKAIVADVAGAVRSQKLFMARFDRDVPEVARFAVYREIAMGSMRSFSPVDAGGIRKFTSHPAGRELADEWGSDAATCIATVWERVERIIEPLFDDDRDAMFDWFETLTPVEAKAILRRLI